MQECIGEVILHGNSRVIVGLSENSWGEAMKAFFAIIILCLLILTVGCGGGEAGETVQELERATDGTISFIVPEGFDYSFNEVEEQDDGRYIYFNLEGAEPDGAQHFFAITYPFEFDPYISNREVIDQYDIDGETYIEWSQTGAYKYSISIEYEDILVYTPYPEEFEEEVKMVAESIK